MYEYINGQLVYNPNAGLMSGFNMDPIATRQDFSVRGEGSSASILKPFDANLGNIDIGGTGPAFTGGFDLSQFNTGGGSGAGGGRAKIELPTTKLPIIGVEQQMLDLKVPDQLNPVAAPYTMSSSYNAEDGGGGGFNFGGFNFGGFGSRFASNLKSPGSMAGIASGLGGIIGGLMGRGARRDAQAAAQREYDKMKAQYMDLDTRNIYADVRNKYLNMENAYEDLTVNKQQAEFEKNMFDQQQANVMANLRGAAGSSGIAGLAQALSNQALVQSQKAAGSIGLQESRNQIFKAREASKIQFAERGGEAQAEAMRLAGAETARGLEYQKTGTLFGMAQQDLAGANAAVAAGDAALYGGIGSLAGTVLSAGIGAII
jgi:hypothetical protein